MAEKKKQKHDCPKIDSSIWNVKVTGPAYRDGMSAAEARSAWFAHLRTLRTAVAPMPRKTSN